MTKVAFLLTTAGQYNTPLAHELAKEKNLALTVYFCSEDGAKTYYDEDYRRYVQWDGLEMEGYTSIFMPNWSVKKGYSYLNPSIVMNLYREKFDVLIIHGYSYWTAWLALITAKVCGTKVIFRGEVHPSENSRASSKFLKKIFFSQTDAFLSLGKKAREFYQSYDIDQHKVFDHPYTVNNKKFDKIKTKNGNKNAIYEKFKLNTKLKTVLYLSKLSRRKRPFDLVLAFEKLEIAQAQLLIVGTGEQLEPIKHYVRKNNIKNIRFAGFLGQNEVHFAYTVADIFVLTSSFEPWGLVVNEAMNFELPVIATYETASAHDLIIGKETGDVYEAGNISKLHSILERLLLDEKLYEKYSTNAKKIITNWSHREAVYGVKQAISYVQKL